MPTNTRKKWTKPESHWKFQNTGTDEQWLKKSMKAKVVACMICGDGKQIKAEHIVAHLIGKHNVMILRKFSNYQAMQAENSRTGRKVI